MYVITGATGNTGKEIATALLAAGQKVTVIGRSAERLQPLTAKGAKPAVGSLDDAEFLAKTLQGAKAVYAMIPPNYAAENFRVYQNRIADALVSAVKQAGVKYVVALSSVGAHLTEKAGVVQGLYDMEQKFNQLKDVHVLYLRPTYFMENLLGQIGTIKQMGIMGSPLKPDLKFPIIATKDIAAVGAKRLLALDFTGKSVQYILGARDVTNNEIATVFGKAIGKPDLKYVQFPYADAKNAMVGMGLSASAAEAMVEFMQSMNEGRTLSDVRRTPENTTPTTLEAFAKIFASIYQQA
jgi:uncharacterized protein YbjT (DUF2867 family)